MTNTSRDTLILNALLSELVIVDVDGPIILALESLAVKHGDAGTTPTVEEVKQVIEIAMKC